MLTDPQRSLGCATNAIEGFIASGPRTETTDD